MKKFINVRLKGRFDPVQILVDDDGIIKEISPSVSADAETEDLEGRLVVPPYVDPHIHLDYVYTAESGAMNTLFDGIRKWSETKGSITPEILRERALRGIKQELHKGVQFIRTHVDITDPSLTGLKVLLELREALKNDVTIQIVAFPQEGIYAYKGGEELLEESLKMGADCVGGIPHYEFARELGEKSIHKIVELAVKYNKMIDVHCDETDDIQSRFLELLNALVYAEGIGRKTAASHTCSFGSADNSYAFRLMSQLLKSEINFISCPTENIYLQGRQDTYPKRRGLTRVKELNDVGINVCFAQDSMSDPWYPLGNGNMMNILDHGIHICQMMSPSEIENALDLVTVNGAKTMMIDDYGIDVGKSATFIVIDAKSEFEAVCERAGVLASVRKGRYLFKRKRVETTDYADIFSV